LLIYMTVHLDSPDPPPLRKNKCSLKTWSCITVAFSTCTHGWS
jgi:hypothetical protein